MTTENWIDLPTLQDVAKAQADGWEIEIQTDPGNDKYCPWKFWEQATWNGGIAYRGRPRQPVLTVDLPVTEVVQLQNSADGLWAHFRVGKGYAYSINLDVDKIGHRFANEYREAVGGKPIQLVMKEIKMECLLIDGELHWRSEYMSVLQSWIRQPHLDLIVKVPE